MIISELNGTVRITQEGPIQDLNGNVYLDENPDSYELDGDVDFDEYYYQQVNPTGVTPQVVSLALEIEGYGIISPYQLINGISWERDIEGGAKITFSVDGGIDSPIGVELDWKGPPPGTRNITLWAAYISNGIPRWSKLITGAIADHSSRKISRTKREMTITVLGPEFRHETKEVDYNLDSGHKRTPQQIIKDILAIMQVDNVVIDDGVIKRLKPIDIVCQPGLSHCREEAQSIAKVLYFDKENNVRLIARGYDKDLVQSQYFNEFNTIDIGDDIEIESDGGEVATHILVTGEVTFEKDCGLRNVTTEYILKETFAPLSASYTQDTGGGINPYGLVLPEIERIRRKVVRVLTYDCKTLIQEKVMTFEWKNPRTWRYTLDGTVEGDILGWNFGYFLDAVPSITSELYAWDQEKFVQISELTTKYDYSDGVGLAFDGGWLYPPVASNHRNRTVYSGYRFPKSALKTNIGDPTLPWEQTAFIPSKKITGGGEGVDDDYTVESYFGEKSGSFSESGLSGYLQYDLFVNDIRDDGYITRDRKYVYATKVVPGTSYLYAGGIGNTSKYEDEKILVNVMFDVVIDNENTFSKEINLYAADEQSGLKTIRTTIDYNFNPPRAKDEDFYGDGYLPFAEFKEREGTNIDVQSFEFIVEAPVLLISHPYFKKPLSNSLIETEQEAQDLAVSELRELSALPIVFNVPFNIPIDCGKKVRLHIRRSKINHEVFVRNVSGSWEGLGSPIVTKVFGRIYTI